MIGSHYDTVHDGGKFDGALGIIVGISAVKAVLLEVGGWADGWMGGGISGWWGLAAAAAAAALHMIGTPLQYTLCWPRHHQKIACVCQTRRSPA
jgi:hypothetical protein